MDYYDKLIASLPIILLIITFLLKLTVNRKVDRFSFINALCELPVDILFLAFSFCLAFTVSTPNNLDTGIIYSLVSLVILIIVISLWRIVESLLSSKKIMIMALLLSLNFMLSISSLAYSISLFIEEENIPQKKVEIIK